MEILSIIGKQYNKEQLKCQEVGMMLTSNDFFSLLNERKLFWGVKQRYVLYKTFQIKGFYEQKWMPNTNRRSTHSYNFTAITFFVADYLFKDILSIFCGRKLFRLENLKKVFEIKNLCCVYVGSKLKQISCSNSNTQQHTIFGFH